MDALPHWPRGTAAVLCAAGPHPIPVSTAVRASDSSVLVALGGKREALLRLRQNPQAALCVLAEDVAFTAIGRVAVVQEGVEVSKALVVIELEVTELIDHLADGRTRMLGGPRWEWQDEQAAESDPRIHAELDRLAARAA